MAQEGPNRLAEWLLLARRQWPVVRKHFDQWLAAVREEPALIWQTVAIRYAVYGLSATVVVLVAAKAIALLTPPPPASARPVASTADYHVVCSNQQCGHHFVIHRKFGFRGFPVPCPECSKETGMQARKCPSPQCQGRWVTPQRSDGALQCPRCGQPFDGG